MDAQLNAFGLSAFSSKSGMQLPDNSPTASLSCTVSISEPGDWLNLDEKTMEELSEFGDVARLDISLGAVLRCVLVTFFDVRCAQRLLLQCSGRAEPFPPAAHDCRIVSVNMAAFANKALMGGGFAQFGEVANISMNRGDAIVEFYDMRSAQFLLTAAGGSAQPYTDSPATTSGHASAALGLDGLSNLNPSALPHLPSGFGAGPGLGAVVTGQSPLPAGPLARGGLPARAPTPSSAASASPSYSQSLTPSVSRRGSVQSMQSMLSEDATPTSAAGADGDKPKAQSNRPVRTKVTTKDFSKYDIDPEKIQEGQDTRTTVMVRNLTGPRARKEFLQFLERCGLADRYTFFYMPCKEHRNVPAGFAFLNLVEASDVHKLFVMVKSGFWREFLSDPSSKAPAMSYARFQGHEELTKHFSSSAVLHEQDPEKRPIFRPDAGKLAAQEPKMPAPKTAPAPATEADAAAPSVNQMVQGEAALHMALEQGAREIAAILMRQGEKSPSQAATAPSESPSATTATPKSTKAAANSKDAPAYISVPSIQEAISTSKGTAAGAMRLQGIQEDGVDAAILDSEQMGA